MRKVDRAPHPNAKKGPKRWPMGAVSVSVLILRFYLLDLFCCGRMIVKVVPFAEDMTSMRPP